MAITLKDTNDYIFAVENKLRYNAVELKAIADGLRESDMELATRLFNIADDLIEQVGLFNVANVEENAIAAFSILGSTNHKSVNITRWYRSESKPTRAAFILNWEMAFGIEVYDYVLEILKGFNVDGVTLSPSAIVAITHAINVREQG